MIFEKSGEEGFAVSSFDSVANGQIAFHPPTLYYHIITNREAVHVFFYPLVKID